MLRAIKQIRQKNLQSLVAEKSTHLRAHLLPERPGRDPSDVFETQRGSQPNKSNIAALGKRETL